MDTLSYGREKYYSAVRFLCLSEVSLHERLIKVFINDLMHITENNLQPALWKRHKEIKNICTQEGSFADSIPGLGEKEVVRIIEEIVSIHSQILKESK